MSFKISNRILSKKSKIIKDIKEIYTHENLSFFPQDYSFEKPIMILGSEILHNNQSILLCKDYNYLICTAILSQKQCYEKQIEKLMKLNKSIVIFRNEFVAEIPQSKEMDILNNVKNYLGSNHPEGNFRIIATWDDLRSIVTSKEYQDLLYVNKSESPSEEDLELLHIKGKVSKGTLMINPLNNSEGEIVQKDGRIKVRGSEMNRAMHGDEVYIENNRIVGISKMKTRIIVGTLFDIKPNHSCNEAFVRPIDRRFPDIKVLTHFTMPFKKVVVHVFDWIDSHPVGVIFKILGDNGNIEDEIEAILEHFQIDYIKDDPYSRFDHYNNSDHYDFTVEKAYDDIKNGRRDLRHLNVCSIDPQGCTDIDDALHCIINDDYIEVGVHIADVSFYVHPDSFLDIEARNRSTTVYFPDRRIDMLPPFLSSNLCSLLENQDRATFSCVWRFDKDFNVIHSDIFRSIIRSRKSFSYEQAYELITSNTSSNTSNNLDIKESLVKLLQISSVLRERRFNSGALELNTQELSIDPNNNIKINEHVPTHYLVEEFMLLANITVASFIYKHNPEYSLLRKHPLPSVIELDIVDSTNSKTLNDSLKKLNPSESTIVKRIITRSMQQALYFCSGESPDFYHYGLATDIYTHFTSPIRRYPDIVVHRTVSYILEGKDKEIDGLREVVNKKNCSLMNFRHRNAQNASRMVEMILMLKAIKEDRLKAKIVTIKDNGMVVFIEKYGIEGLIKRESIGSEIMNYSVFQEIEVRIKRDIEDYCFNREISIEMLY